MCAGGQTERHCGKVGGRSDELAPANDSPGVYTSGQGHGRCYLMRILDQISALVAVAEGGEGVGGAGSMGSWGSRGVRADEMNPCRSYYGYRTLTRRIGQGHTVWYGGSRPK